MLLKTGSTLEDFFIQFNKVLKVNYAETCLKISSRSVNPRVIAYQNQPKIGKQKNNENGKTKITAFIQSSLKSQISKIIMYKYACKILPRATNRFSRYRVPKFSWQKQQQKETIRTHKS